MYDPERADFQRLKVLAGNSLRSFGLFFHPLAENPLGTEENWEAIKELTIFLKERWVENKVIHTHFLRSFPIETWEELKQYIEENILRFELILEKRGETSVQDMIPAQTFAHIVATMPG